MFAKCFSSLVVVSQWLQSEDIDSSEESTRHSGSLEHNQFTQSLPTVSVTTSICSIQCTHQKVHNEMEQDISVSFSGALTLNLGLEFQSPVSITDQVESCIVAR